MKPRTVLRVKASQFRGAWNSKEHIVQENRTEALDASRRVIRDRRVVLPRGGPVIQEFAEHVTRDSWQPAHAVVGTADDFFYDPILHAEF